MGGDGELLNRATEATEASANFNVWSTFSHTAAHVCLFICLYRYYSPIPKKPVGGPHC